MKIIEDDLTGAAVIALLGEHLEGMAKSSPPESIYALGLEGLRAPDVTFWTAWDGSALLGCGALKELDPEHGEIKSMRTAKAHLRKGVASAILKHIIAEARARSYRRLSLETGTGEAFDPAHALYQRFGFVYCGPFGEYRDSSFNAFMTLSLP